MLVALTGRHYLTLFECKAKNSTAFFKASYYFKLVEYLCTLHDFHVLYFDSETFHRIPGSLQLSTFNSESDIVRRQTYGCNCV